MLNELEQENSDRELYEILTRADEIVDVLTNYNFFHEKLAFSNLLNIYFTSQRSSGTLVKSLKLEIPIFIDNIINWRGFLDQ